MDASSISITNRDGSTVNGDFEDSAGRARLRALRSLIAETSARIDSGDIGGGTETPEEPDDGSFKTAEEAIAALDANWDTDDIWETMARSEKAINADPSQFLKYVGKELTLTHSEYGSHNVRVVGVAHDEKADGTGKAAFTIEYVNCPFKAQQNTSDTTSGGWPNTALRKTLESAFFDGLPEAIRGVIVSVNKPCSLTQGATAGDVELKVWLPSETEILGTTISDNEGTQYAYYSANNSALFRRKKYNSSASTWWLRSVSSTTRFALLNNNGEFSNYNASSSEGVSPCFCVGAPRDVSKQVKRLEDAWGTDDVWNVMHEVSDDVRENPSAFSDFIGRELMYTHGIYGIHHVRVVGVAHDEKADGSGKAAFTFDHVELVDKLAMNTNESTSGGFPSCNLRVTLNNANSASGYYGGLPASIKNLVVSVSKPCSLTKGAEPTKYDCNVFIASGTEIVGDDASSSEGKQYEYWAINNNDDARKKAYNGTDSIWWLRSPSTTKYFCTVDQNGKYSSINANSSQGVSPMFCID